MGRDHSSFTLAPPRRHWLQEAVKRKHSKRKRLVQRVEKTLWPVRKYQEIDENVNVINVKKLKLSNVDILF